MAGSFSPGELRHRPSSPLVLGRGLTDKSDHVEAGRRIRVIRREFARPIPEAPSHTDTVAFERKALIVSSPSSARPLARPSSRRFRQERPRQWAVGCLSSPRTSRILRWDEPSPNPSRPAVSARPPDSDDVPQLGQVHALIISGPGALCPTKRQMPIACRHRPKTRGRERNEGRRQVPTETNPATLRPLRRPLRGITEPPTRITRLATWSACSPLLPTPLGPRVLDNESRARKEARAPASHREAISETADSQPRCW